ncbi:hypothetical protein NR798_16990 [Archangium gephyra]|uniref:toxin-antitoxin system YwqK family antitoxin n=1 Tax=Archangium gephyra TaxID=48 RepID=UPI0035D51BF7
MSLKIVSRTLAILAMTAAPVALAEGASSANAAEVRLACPAGTVQKGRKVSKTEGVFCVKVSSRDGEAQLHGPYVDFHSNGQKQSEGQYSDGARAGLWTFWDANGVKTGETQFAGGNYHGKRVEYFPNGKQRLVEEYANGKRNGLVQEFSEDGKVVRQAQYRDDQQVAAK